MNERRQAASGAAEKARSPVICFSIRDLICHGTLAGVRPGMRRNEVATTLGPPDQWLADSDAAETSPIWRYGNFEIHFLPDGTVSTLFLDYLSDPQAGAGRALDAWILASPFARTLAATLERLRDEGVTAVESALAGTPILRVAGGANLLFDEVDGQPIWQAIATPQIAHA